MKRVFLAVVLLAGLALAGEGKYFVFFADKGEAEKANWREIARQNLSERALRRRQRLNIPLDWYDLPVNENYVRQVQRLGAEIVHRSRWLNAVSVRCDEAVLARIRALPFVVDVRPVRVFRAKFPSPERGFRREVEDSVYGTAFRQAEMLGVPVMHQAGYRGRGVLIGMLDSGFKIDVSAFDSILASGRLVAKYDFVHNDTSVGFDSSAGDWDLEGYVHGTMTFSCIGANVPGVMVGVAPEASFALAKTEITDTMGVDFERQIEEDNWVAGIEWLDSLGVDIVSSSLGYYDFQGDSQDYSFDQLNGDFAITTVAADVAASRGIAVFNSAGNERGSSWNHIIAPADGDSVCAVGAVQFNGEYAFFSSPGPTADGRIKPDLTAPGFMVAVWSPDYDMPVYASGTSFSCPITAGSAALVLQALREDGDSTIGGWDLVEILKSAADQADSPDNDYGWGIPLVPVAAGLRDGVFGQVVNASTGAPMDSAVLIFGSDTVFTDARGRFAFMFAPADTEINLRAQFDGFVSHDTTFPHRRGQVHHIHIELAPVLAGDWEILCYPDPFADTLSITWRDHGEKNAYVRIFAADGSLIRDFASVSFVDFGFVKWDGRDNSGNQVAPGVYVVVVQIEDPTACCADVKTLKFKVFCAR